MEATPSTLNSIFVSSTQARVGVSSTVPTHTLSVGGDVNFSGNLYKNGALFSSGASLSDPATFYIVTQADLAAKVSKSGDTMTGNLSAVNYTITASSINAANYLLGGLRVLTAPNYGNTTLGIYGGYHLVGSGNTSLGYESGYGSPGVAPEYNSSVGWQSLRSISTGRHNSVLGAQAGYSINTGHSNVVIGPYSGGGITSSSSNTIVGPLSGTTSLGSGNILIGKSVNVASGASDSLNIGNAIKGDLSVSSISVMGAFSAPEVCINSDCKTAWPTGGTGSGGGNSWVEENFYSQTNGSQTQFTLSQVPTANSLTLSKNGVVMVSPADYSLTNQLITMVTAPASSTTLVANYAVSIATDIAAIKIDGQPIGTIIAYSTTTPPSGYLYCDGSYVSTTTYADLFAITGHRYSTYTVTGTPSVFQLPDLRGMFLRGALGNLNSRDPNANRVVGSTQTDTFQGHYHRINTYAGAGGSGGAYQGGINATNDAMVQVPITDGTNGTPRTGPETRPENVAVAYMIKYAHSGTATIQLATTSVILATNNSFAGSNTFTGAVSVSSITMTGYVNGVIKSSVSVRGAVLSSSQATLVVCQSTLTLTTSGLSRIEADVNGRIASTNAADFYIDILVNGVRLSGNEYYGVNGGAGVNMPVGAKFITDVLPSGTNNICLSIARSAGTATAYINWWIKEIR